MCCDKELQKALNLGFRGNVGLAASRLRATVSVPRKGVHGSRRGQLPVRGQRQNGAAGL